jgi:hypothetical protein
MQYSLRFLLFVFILSFYQLTPAQSFKIGTIDVYGNRKTDANTILEHLNVKEGDSISHDNFRSADIASRLEQIPGVKHATVNPICCDTTNNLMLFIGIGETDSVILKYRKAPTQQIRLPGKMIDAYKTSMLS